MHSAIDGRRADKRGSRRCGLQKIIASNLGTCLVARKCAKAIFSEAWIPPQRRRWDVAGRANDAP
jgi:hypothetical protein